MENIPIFPSFDARIKAQVELWRRRSSTQEEELTQNPPFITISRQFGCPAFSFAKMLSEDLQQKFDHDFIVYDRKLMEWVCSESNVSENLIKSLSKRTRGEIEDWIMGLISGEASEMKAFKSLAFAVRAIASQGHSILIGRGSSLITANMKNAIHVRLVAPLAWRIEYFKQNYPEKSELANETAFMEIDKQREGFVKKYLSGDLADPAHYHIVINSSKIDLEKEVSIVSSLIK